MNRIFGLLVSFIVAFAAMPAAAATGKWVDTTMKTGNECVISYVVGHKNIFSVGWTKKNAGETAFFVNPPKKMDYGLGYNIVLKFSPSGKSRIVHNTEAKKVGNANIFFEPINNDVKGYTNNFALLQTETGLSVEILTTNIDPDVVLNIPLVPATNALSDFIFCKMGKKGSDSDEDTEEKE